MVYIKYKVKWRKVFSAIVSVGMLWTTFKILLILAYEIKGYFKWFMPLLGYNQDTPCYYLVNEINKNKHGNMYLGIIFVIVGSIFVLSFLWLIQQNIGKKLLIIEHSSLQSMSFSYDKEELEEYVIKKYQLISIRQ